MQPCQVSCEALTLRTLGGSVAPTPNLLDLASRDVIPSFVGRSNGSLEDLLLSFHFGCKGLCEDYLRLM